MQDERGQAMIETGVLLTLILLLTVCVVDAGRGFYQYNLTAAAARFGGRWASVVGGTCAVPIAASVSDWCNQDGANNSSFWSQPGNAPLQTGGTSCPSSFDPNFTGYYSVAAYAGATATTIVGAIAQHFDTTAHSSGLVDGALMPGLNLSQLKVCIQLTWNSAQQQWSAQPGDRVGVYVYYPYAPVTPLLTALHQINLTASSSYRID